MDNFKYLLSDINVINKIGQKTSKLLKKKNINSIFDLLLKIPKDKIDRSKAVKIKNLKINEVQSVIINVKKYNFPRIRKLPNRVNCEDDTGKIDCIFFNSYEGYIKKILPLNKTVTVSGKINYYKGRYQITNPTYVSSDKDKILKVQSKYSLTDGISEKKYNYMIGEVKKNLPNLKEWHSQHIIKKFDNISWKQAILSLHDPNKLNQKNKFMHRLIYDEIFATLLIKTKIRLKLKKTKKNAKIFEPLKFNEIKKFLDFNLTNDQIKSINQIQSDLRSESKMFRLLQGDVGSGKTIVALLSAMNVVKSGYQVSFMSPTEILTKQHYNLTKSLFNKKIKIEMLTGKTLHKDRKKILSNLKENKIDILFGTHSLFQEKVEYKKLGLIIIDEQHKFGVKQRKALSDKGGNNCDILVMSATPIPRTMIMTIFGDMDTSIIKEKPKNRKPVITYSKFENKISDVLSFVRMQILNKNQIFWVCPLIDESKKIDHQSSIKRHNDLKKFFGEKVGLLHGKISNEEKDNILIKFLNKEIDILVSTTVIEVGIDFPNANTIIIENANKFGLSQLHQLRGRVGRGEKQSYCILMFKNSLSENAKKRIKILKSSNDGFKISEDDMMLRGYGDLLGFKQSGMETFRMADPIKNENLFLLAEKEIKNIELNNKNINRFNHLLKLYDRADVLVDDF
tara:strand:+ start:1001 stop:3040 length:2040 start_codon:yes stop_codon:yes gene_type:complete